MAPTTPPADNANDRNATSNDAQGLACNRCRRCKLRCTRERPSCAHCKRHDAECAYESKRIKPGLKAGAVENLHRRLDALEQLVRERDDRDTTSNIDGTCSDKLNSQLQHSIANTVITLLANELPKLVGASPQSTSGRDSPLSLQGSETRSTKRRRLMEERSSISSHSHRRLPGAFTAPELPEPAVLESIIEVYFSHIHHWIPMVHEERLVKRLQDANELPKLSVLLHAMVIGASRYLSNQEGLAPVGDWAAYQAWLVSMAIQTLSVESLQALIIIAHTEIGNGHGEKAWPIVGSLTRTAEYLQLTVEHEENERQPLCQPFCPVGPAEDWTEVEERRRVFWNVFCLDRLCSVTMGWNTSLTSDDVCRRLPCEGRLWRRQEPVLTPYFGIWDKSAAKIGNPITFMPADHQSPKTTENESSNNRHQGTSSPTRASSAGDANMMSTMGAYAYAIEATESMSRVTSYFLQQKVNTRDHEEITSWLTRFKELDLRLVHWKMLLPQRWRKSSTTNNGSSVAPHPSTPMTKMDPNLTMAHITHNASMILLHQLIAYPPRSWSFRNRLPSRCSAETCYTAAIEIANIVKSYLHMTPSHLPLCPQFSFCVFIAARIFLTHWRYYAESRLGDDFWSLMQGLENMSQRWTRNGHGPSSPGEPDLAGKYVTKLRELHHLCSGNEGFSINVAGYTTDILHRAASAMDQGSRPDFIPSSPATVGQQQPEQADSITALAPHEQASWVTFTGGVADTPPPPPPSQHGGRPNMRQPPPPPIQTMGHANLDLGEHGGTPMIAPTGTSLNDGACASEYNSAFSQGFVDQSFMNMDRVISFNGGNIFDGDVQSGGMW